MGRTGHKPGTSGESEQTMATLTVKIRGNDHCPRECGIEIDGTCYSTDDLDEITNREDAEAAGIPTALLDEYRGNWGLFGVWLEDRAVWGGPKTPAADLQEFSQRLRVRQSLIRIAIAKLIEDTNRCLVATPTHVYRSEDLVHTHQHVIQ
jgi:hypothetical protein